MDGRGCAEQGLAPEVSGRPPEHGAQDVPFWGGLPGLDWWSRPARHDLTRLAASHPHPCRWLHMPCLPLLISLSLRLFLHPFSVPKNRPAAQCSGSTLPSTTTTCPSPSPGPQRPPFFLLSLETILSRPPPSTYYCSRVPRPTRVYDPASPRVRRPPNTNKQGERERERDNKRVDHHKPGRVVPSLCLAC